MGFGLFAFLGSLRRLNIESTLRCLRRLIFTQQESVAIHSDGFSVLLFLYQKSKKKEGITLKPNNARLTTLVSYPERGTGGNSKYRGNCSPKVIEDLLRFYQPEMVCDYMVGSGTTYDAAAACAIPCHGYDLNGGFDLLNCDIPERSPFTFWHPPYHDIVLYSDVMYKSEDIQNRFGFDPRKSDLSRIPKWEDFVKALNYCCTKQFAALEKGGHMAVLMGDIKRHGKLYSMLAEIAKPGTLEQIIIKAQHNCYTTNQHDYRSTFIPIVHEYIMIVRKDDSLIFPVGYTKSVPVDIRDMHGSTWRDVMVAVMEQHKGTWTLEALYREVEGHTKAKNNSNWKAKIRQTLQRYTTLFRHDGKGQWSLVAA